MVWSCWWCWEGEELDFKGRGRERVKRLWWWWEREERDEANLGFKENQNGSFHIRLQELQ